MSGQTWDGPGIAAAVAVMLGETAVVTYGSTGGNVGGVEITEPGGWQAGRSLLLGSGDADAGTIDRDDWAGFVIYDTDGCAEAYWDLPDDVIRNGDERAVAVAMVALWQDMQPGCES